ncbi:OmpA family protein [Planktotalea sp.]|uniref:OmpA family protein n=1 Tax=Planktotalea sp. TaxID=2029877 RepID=UPI003F6D17D4
MFISLLRSHLPWVAPTAAIVFAASTGFFDRSGSTEQVTQAPAQVAYDINAQAQAAPRVASGAFQPTQQDQIDDADVVTRLSVVTDSSLQALQPEAAPAPEPFVAPVVQAPVAPVVEPAKPAVQVASLQESEEAALFFANAQAKLIAQESCVSDLRSLTEQARVYFPAGGLTLDEGGLAQARLIADLARDCAGVQIIVEGHSDPSGDPAVNLRLSKQRAEQVIQRLGARGLDTDIFIAEGLGSKRPSGVTGPRGDAYYDRRVEFVVVETNQAARTFKATPAAWASSSCVKELESAISNAQIFYSPRSVAASQDDVSQALLFASMAMDCPDARLRVIGQHSDDRRIGENPATGRLRAKALMAMLVGQGIDAGQIIMAAPSRSMATDELSGSRLDFDVILD